MKSLRLIDEPLFFPQAAIACMNGVLWTIASIAVLSAIDRMGLARSNQWKSLQGPISSALMLTFFSEFLTLKVVFIALAVVFITLAAMMFSTKEKDAASVDTRGILYALTAAVFYGLYTFTKKYLTDVSTLFSQQIYTSLFIIISATVFVLVKYGTIKADAPGTKRDILMPLLGGLLFYGNAGFNVLAYRYIEGSIVSMLHQLNAIWLFLIGVFIFKELSFKDHWPRLTLGLILSVAGVIMLVLAKV
jgi:glucose uptake protein GlcU